MYVQTEITPNPNSLKFIPGKKVSKVGPLEILDSKDTENELLKNILSINGVRGIFLYENFISVNKSNNIDWSDLKHIIISYINDFYLKGNEFVISDNVKKNEKNLDGIETITRKLCRVSKLNYDVKKRCRKFIKSLYSRSKRSSIKLRKPN